MRWGNKWFFRFLISAISSDLNQVSTNTELDCWIFSPHHDFLSSFLKIPWATPHWVNQLKYIVDSLQTIFTEQNYILTLLSLWQILEGTEITTWRTAAASVVATKHLHRGDKKVLAVIGAGTQGKIHAVAMKHFFNFTEV